MRVLLVDDELHVRRALAAALDAWGHRVTEAATGADATAALDREPFDLIVLDVNLPDATGWDVLRHLETTNQSGMPVVMISAIAPSVARLREFRPIGVLHKPFPIDSLHRLVARAELQGAGMRRLA